MFNELVLCVLELYIMAMARYIRMNTVTCIDLDLTKESRAACQRPHNHILIVLAN